MKLVLLPGFMGVSTDWGAVIAALPGSISATVLMAPYSDLLAERFVLCGYSMGGRVAISLANSAGCRGVISVSSSPGILDETERPARRAADEAIARRLEGLRNEAEFRAFLEEWWSQPVFGGSTLSPVSKESLIASRLKLNPVEVAHHLREFGPGAMRSHWEDWKHLSIPKLAIAGEGDPKYVALAKAMGSHEIVANSGHQIPLEQPAELARLIEKFWRQLPEVSG